jgi:hypothetical protein
MFAKSKTGIILKAIIIALAWVSIMNCTIFPDLVKDGKKFLAEQYNFDYVGQILLFAIGIYTLDLTIQVLYAVEEHLSIIFFIPILGSVAICVLVISLAKNMDTNNGYPLLFVGFAMGYMKALTLIVSDMTKKVKRHNTVQKNRRSII